jgi:hypothetical protein
MISNQGNHEKFEKCTLNLSIVFALFNYLMLLAFLAKFLSASQY